MDRFKTEEFSPQSSGLRIEISNAAIECKNNEITRYFGVVTQKQLSRVRGSTRGAPDPTELRPSAAALELDLKCGDLRWLR